MSEDFVRKDIYELETRRLDGRIDEAVLRMEARNEASVLRSEAAITRMGASFEELKAQNAAFREHVTNELYSMKGDIRHMQGEISALKSDVSNISKNVALIMTIFGLVISAVSIAIQVWK